MHATDSRPGLLIANVGTPDSPLVGDVRRFLRQFLMDPRIIDLPLPMRWLLVHVLILPFRPWRSAAAYRSVWTDRGSPLLVHGRDLAERVRERLRDVPVELGMRYGHPSVTTALVALRRAGADRVVVLPLLPQYSPSAWGSLVQRIYLEAGKLWNAPALQVVPPYFDHPAFVGSYAAVAGPVLRESRPDRVLMSFHGQPKRHALRADDNLPARCLSHDDCCAFLSAANRTCYRAQCFATARALAGALELPDEDYELSFQSRLGKAPWIGPHTDQRLRELAAEGVKRVAVLCPSFTADCLETLEEIGARERRRFLAAGGEELTLVPCVNSGEDWVDGVLELVRPLVR